MDTPSPPYPPLDNGELPYWVAWAHLAIPAAVVWKIFDAIGSARTAWTASADRLRAAGVSASLAVTIERQRPEIDPETAFQRVAGAGLSLCTFHDPDYPPLLKHIHDPPIALFYRGRLTELGPTIAIVGTRRASDYGLQVTWELASALAKVGLTVVSGLALGVDTAAHKATLEVKGRTLAILGGGADAPTLYPPSNRALADAIAASDGAVLSEYPPGTPPLPYRFPERNRIIAGLSLGTIVTEAPIKSGALITARVAAEENREVFAVPGRIIDVNAAGPNRLLYTGATLVRNADDVLAALNIETATARQPFAESGLTSEENPEAAILACLQEPLNRDELQRKSLLPTATLAATLTLLEIQGAVRKLPSGKIFRANGR